MSNKKGDTETGQTLNEFGGEYKYEVGGKERATDKNAGPNASVYAGVETNDWSAKAGVGADANAFELTGKNVEAKAFGAEVGADAEAGFTGLGAEAKARVRLIEAEGAGFGVRLGAGVTTGATIGLGGVGFKLAGTGLSIGKKTSISVFDNEISVDFSKLGKAFKFW